jgi:hypothetical protein
MMMSTIHNHAANRVNMSAMWQFAVLESLGVFVELTTSEGYRRLGSTLEEIGRFLNAH